MWVRQQVIECGTKEIGGGVGNPDRFYTGVLAGGNVKTGDRQIEGLGQQPEAGLIGPAFQRRGGHPESQGTIDLADDPFPGRLRLKVDTEGGGFALLPNQNHWLRFQAISWREGINHRWTNWSARIAMMGEMSNPNRHIGIIC